MNWVIESLSSFWLLSFSTGKITLCFQSQVAVFSNYLDWNCVLSHLICFGYQASLGYNSTSVQYAAPFTPYNWADAKYSYFFLNISKIHPFLFISLAELHGYPLIFGQYKLVLCGILFTLILSSRYYMMLLKLPSSPATRTMTLPCWNLSISSFLSSTSSLGTYLTLGLPASLLH